MGDFVRMVSLGHVTHRRASAASKSLLCYVLGLLITFKIWGKGLPEATKHAGEDSLLTSLRE